MYVNMPRETVQPVTRTDEVVHSAPPPQPSTSALTLPQLGCLAPVGRTARPGQLPPTVFVAAPLATVTLADVQAFSDSLVSQAPCSRTRTLAAVQSLLPSAGAPRPYRYAVLPRRSSTPRKNAHSG
jgi:hypothetical protein